MNIIEGIIEEIEYVDAPTDMDVYDIGVADNHNFFAENTLVHNCHNIPSNTIFNVACQAKNAYYRIGVSATPWRDIGDDLLIESVLNIRKPQLSINASKLIAKGKLTPCSIHFIPVNNDIEWQGNYNDTYDAVIANNSNRNQLITNLTVKMQNDGRTTLILIKKINHGELLLRAIKSRVRFMQKSYEINGKSYVVGNIEFVSGNDDIDRREAVFQAVKEKFCKILIGSTIADEGLDIPSLDTLILAGGGKSSTRAFQRVGRVLRLYTNPDGTKKENALVFDFMDSNSTFYNQFLYRKALYETEPLWKINVLTQQQANNFMNN